ncbi:CHAPERONIN [Salix viminalis]|uniref:T-complex protein 1 subunit delta n=1 Tax=Salix viminalis TaxID=40686 RepID=A0A9Q0NWD8_SALVM|nr:CHAPERONIN [Salix viminalis]
MALIANSAPRSSKTESYVDNKRKEDIRHANIKSACAVADAVRTSLGPKGMDKMISTANGEVIITNDGATILNKMEVLQPAAKMLVELSKSQDAAAGDGTTTVVVIAGSLLKQCLTLLSSGIHPTVISDSLHKASIKAVDVLTAMAISPPKTDIEQSIVVSDYAQMDRILKEERNYILGMIKKIRATGCNVLLIQKSILRDAVTDLSLHYLAKAKILVIKDVERDEIEFITKTLNCLPIANIEHFKEEKLGYADLVEEVSLGDGKIVKITGIKDMGRNTCVLVRGSNMLVLDEAERSLHDALCVIRCLVNKQFLIAGGGAPEIELSRQLGAWAKVLHGMEGYCVKAFAEALEVIPYTLAENAGLNPITIVTELRNRHAQGEINAGINVRKGQITNILEENVVQPLLVSTSAITLAAECVRMLLKIDDIVTVR